LQANTSQAPHWTIMFNRLKQTKSNKTLANSGGDQKEIEVYPAEKSDYHIIGIIGKGAFAKVYGAECISKSRKMVAVKVIKLETEDSYGDSADIKPLQIADIQQEAAIMSSLKHINIVSCFCSFVVRDELWLIMPFVSGGSVTYILSHSLDGQFKMGIKDENILSCILKDALSGISYMHDQGRIHRDIKGRNILIDGETGTAMLADFGVSGALLEGGLKKRGRNTMTGTPCWMAPEVMKHQRYNHKADIWSLGITALELAFATTPYTKLKSPMKVMMEIMDGKSPTVDSMDKNNKFSKAFKNFISKCLVKDAQKRLSAKELLQTEFIRKAKDKAFMKEKFVKYIKQIQIKKCGTHDLPASLSNKYEVKVDQHGDEQGDDVDGTPSNPNFSFSTSVRLDEEELNSMGDDLDPNDQEQPKTEKKGKFMVTTISNGNNGNSSNDGGKKKFMVTTVQDDAPSQAVDNSNDHPKPQPKKSSSRFHVSQADD